MTQREDAFSLILTLRILQTTLHSTTKCLPLETIRLIYFVTKQMKNLEKELKINA